MEPIRLCGEIHGAGGPGSFYLGRAEELCTQFSQAYQETLQLIYLDPPFGTGERFSMRLDGEQPRLPVYADDMALPEYMAMMGDVLSSCYQMLAPTGALYLHVDYRMAPRLRLLLDEIFGEKNFVNEIIWAYKSGGRSKKHFSRKHDNILLYRKSPRMYFNPEAIGYPRGPGKRNHLKREMDADGRVFFSIRSAGKIYKYYEDSLLYPSDVWDDIEHLHQRDGERTGYSTQKPEALLKRIILASSKPGDLVADFFSGSGTTAAVAAKLGRRFLVADRSPLALTTLRARMLKGQEAPGLLDANQEMRLFYGPDPACESPRVALRSTKTALELSFVDQRPFAYLGAGTADKGFFRPLCCLLSPKPGASLFFRRPNGALLLSVSDGEGRPGFFEPKG